MESWRVSLSGFDLSQIERTFNQLLFIHSFISISCRSQYQPFLSQTNTSTIQSVQTNSTLYNTLTKLGLTTSGMIDYKTTCTKGTWIHHLTFTVFQKKLFTTASNHQLCLKQSSHLPEWVEGIDEGRDPRQLIEALVTD